MISGVFGDFESDHMGWKGAWGCCRQLRPLEQMQAARLSWELGGDTLEWLCNVKRRFCHN